MNLRGNSDCLTFRPHRSQSNTLWPGAGPQVLRKQQLPNNLLVPSHTQVTLYKLASYLLLQGLGISAARGLHTLCRPASPLYKNEISHSIVAASACNFKEVVRQRRLKLIWIAWYNACTAQRPCNTSQQVIEMQILIIISTLLRKGRFSKPYHLVI